MQKSQQIYRCLVIISLNIILITIKINFGKFNQIILFLNICPDYKKKYIFKSLLMNNN